MRREHIEREALLKKLCDDDPANMEDYYYNAIANFPSADVVEVRHGEWIYCSETINLRSHFYCSACNGARYEHYAKNNFRYCPSCGAKMDGKKI